MFFMNFHSIRILINFLISLKWRWRTSEVIHEYRNKGNPYILFINFILLWYILQLGKLVVLFQIFHLICFTSNGSSPYVKE